VPVFGVNVVDRTPESGGHSHRTWRVALETCGQMGESAGPRGAKSKSAAVLGHTPSRLQLAMAEASTSAAIEQLSPNQLGQYHVVGDIAEGTFGKVKSACNWPGLAR